MITPSRLLEFGPFRLDPVHFLLLRGEEPVEVRKKAVQTLLVLIENRGQVVSKDELMSAVWPATVVEESNLSQYVYLLRKTLGSRADGTPYIETFPGRGYRFTGEVRDLSFSKDAWLIEGHTISKLVVTEEDLDSESESGPQSAGLRIETAPAHLGKIDRSSDEARRKGLRWKSTGLRLVLPALLAVLLAWGIVRRDEAVQPTSMSLSPVTSYAGSEVEPALSPDGSKVAFIWDRGEPGTGHLFVKLLDVGDPLQLTEGTEIHRRPAWSPDSRHIAFLRGRGHTKDLLIIPAMGGTERRLGQAEEGLDWSPDGRLLAVVHDGAIQLVDVETGERRRITQPPAFLLGDSYPKFSPDGRRLAFVRTDGASADIYVVTLSDLLEKRLTFDNRRVEGLAWSADGSSLLFSSNRSGPYGLWRVWLRGGAPSALNVPQEAHEPSTSRTGSKLVFTQQTGVANVWSLDLLEPPWKEDASERVHGFPLIEASRSNHSPQFSPDGSKIVFISERSGFHEIWICDRDGSNPLQLTSFKGPAVGSPRFSPDGSEIVFDGRLKGQSDIFVIPASGGQYRHLTKGPAQDVVPNWSQDGRWIYFCSLRSGDRQIWKKPSLGGEATQVTQGGGFDSWESPDGQTLFFTRSRELGGIFRMPAAGGLEQLIPGTEGVHVHRYWSASPSGLYFVSQLPPEEPQLRFLDFDELTVRDLGRFNAHPVYGPPGLAVSPDDRTLLFVQRQHSGSDVILVEHYQ